MLKHLAVVFISSWIACLLVLSVQVTGIKPSGSNCKFTLVESIPLNLTYPSGSYLSLSTYAAHKRLMSLAMKEIHIASFYWTLLSSDIPVSDFSTYEGEDIFKTLHEIIRSNKIDVKIAQNSLNNDTDILSKDGAQVRTLDFERLLNAGVLHTKMWVVDDKHLYVGSANFDWRSYTQIKETGVLIEDCQEIVSDAGKIFDIYWYLGLPNSTIPKTWPSSFNTKINATSPIPLTYNNTDGSVYLSSSPPPFCSSGRTTDIDAILNVIHSAKEFVYISVMDYLPLIIYKKPEKFWPIIDDALRKVAFEKKIKVYLLAGCWKHTLGDMFGFLKTLNDMHSVRYVNVYVKYFTVPITTASQSNIPFARVNHSKFMVTDQHAYIGTSNWSGDYFVSTGGVGFIFKPAEGRFTQNGTDLRKQLENIFMRDWSSKYASGYCNATTQNF